MTNNANKVRTQTNGLSYNLGFCSNYSRLIFALIIGQSAIICSQSKINCSWKPYGELTWCMDGALGADGDLVDEECDQAPHHNIKHLAF